MVQDLPGWENPRPKRKTNMTDPLNNPGSSKIGGSPFNTDPVTDNLAIGTQTNNSLGTSSAVTAPITGTNIDPILGIIASTLTFAGGIVVAKGWLDAGSWATISGAVLAIAATGYVAYQNKTSSKINSLATTLNVPKEAFKRHVMSARRGSANVTTN